MGSTALPVASRLSPADRLEIACKAARAAHLPSKHLHRTLILARAKELKSETRKARRKQLAFNI